MENKWQSIFDAISDNDGEIEWVRNNSEGDSPYGVAVAKVNGNPVAAAWIVDGDAARTPQPDRPVRPRQHRPHRATADARIVHQQGERALRIEPVDRVRGADQEACAITGSAEQVLAVQRLSVQL